MGSTLPSRCSRLQKPGRSTPWAAHGALDPSWGSSQVILWTPLWGEEQANIPV